MDTELAHPRSFPGWRDAPFTRSAVFEAAMLLYRAGDWYEARRFFLHLGSGLSGNELGQFGDFLLDQLNEPNFALQLAKDAVTRGEVLMRAYFPVTELVALDLPIPHDLALAIARRESEFDPRVTSHAGAQGLMQVMPATGELTARRIGIAFNRDGLLNDPDYNALLGAHYLAGLLDEFGPALVLVSAGYNAGPGRPRNWITQLGDPRRPGVDPVDWIESIPFTETRNYVMRVLEAVVIYRARLAGSPQPFGLAAELRGR
jgi:soluble lytic murein transglycosylase